MAWCFQSIGDSARRALGLRRARLGRLLGLGSGGKRFAAALDHRHGVPALGDDAGKARHDEGVERLAGVRHVHAVILGTLLTRSGVISSVHAFAQSSIGSWFVAFLAIIFVVCFCGLVEESRLSAQR